MNAIKTSLNIMMKSLALIGQHQKLLLFPLLNMAGIVVIVAFFALPLLLDTSLFNVADQWPAFQEIMEERQANREAGIAQEPVRFGRFTFSEGNMDAPFLLMALLYLMTMFVLTFINVAFYHEILQAFSGNPVSLTRGMAFSRTKLRAILVWSMLAGIVGVIIRQIEEKVGFVGRWITAFIGFAWSVASVFAIPVIIREPQQNNPLTYLKTSATIISRTWGEGLAGVVSISLISILLFIVLTPLIVVLMIILPMLIIPLAIMLFITIFAVGYLGMVVRDIFLCGLYVYATEGVVPGGYDPELMEHAWRVKKRK